MSKIQKQVKLQIWWEQFLYRLLYAASAAVITSLTGAGLTWADIIPFSSALFSEIVIIIICVMAISLTNRVTPEQVARRLDAAGLEERIITALQYQEDKSLIAEKQREDAMECAATLTKKDCPKQWPRRNLVLSGIMIIASIGILIATWFLPKRAVASPVVPSYIIKYVSSEGGSVLGPNTQIDKGQGLSPVQAVAADNYIFIGWSDGVDTPYRQDEAFDKNTSIIALFSPLLEDNDNDDEIPDDCDSSDKPKQPNQDGPHLPGPDGPIGPDGDGDNGESGGRFNASNMVIDSGTYIGDIMGSALGDAANASSGISGGAADAIGGYFSGITGA